MSLVSPDPIKILRKLKLMKDLKYGKVHLRQSLIDIVEFEDMNKVFKNYEDVKITYEQLEQNEEEDNTLMSPIQRIEMYRKERLSKRLNEKMIQGIYHNQANVSRVRVPKTSKMLKRFENKYRNEMPISIKQHLRQSEMNLQKIKRNEKTKFEIHGQNKPLYQSRNIKTTSLLFNQQQDQSQKDQNSTRKRFMSLKTSLPQKQKFIFPSVRQIMKGKLNQKTKKSIIDIKNIQNLLDNYLNQKIKKMKIKIQKQLEYKNSIPISPIKIKYQQSSIQYHSQNNNKWNAKEKKRNQTADININRNVQRSFTRSEQNSKKMIDTMSSFYQTKNEKKQDFNLMHKNLKYDRPLTSSIRRKNYTVLGKQSLRPVFVYRDLSQRECRKIRQNNYQFYCKLIRGLDVFHEQEIPTTVFIVEEVKRVFEIQYVFTQQILEELLQAVNTMEMDQKSQEILSEVAAFVGYALTFHEETN